MLHKLIRKIKFLGKILNKREDIFMVLLIVLVGFGGFGLGRLSKAEEGREPVTIDYSNSQFLISNSPKNTKTQVYDAKKTSTALLGQETGKFVAAINGGRYYSPWCSGAQRIKEENKVWFKTKEDAERAGYTPAKNCKGL